MGVNVIAISPDVRVAETTPVAAHTPARACLGADAVGKGIGRRVDDLEHER